MFRARCLVTCFEPFGGRRTNLSEIALARWTSLRGRRWLAERGIVTARLPVTFAGATRGIRDLVLRERPETVLLTGESRRARKVMVERVALNVAHSHVSDNAGRRPWLDDLDPSRELALRGDADFDRLVRTLRRHGIPVAISHNAGTFVCNAVYFTALALERELAPRPRTVFVHLPGAFRGPRGGRGLHDRLAAAVELCVRSLTGDRPGPGRA